MAQITREKYDQGKIEKLGRYLQFYSEIGEPLDYEILVDGFKAVRRTNDPTLFGLFQNFVSKDTEHIEILFYSGTSNNNERHIFILRETPETELQNEELGQHLYKLGEYFIGLMTNLQKENNSLQNNNDSIRNYIAEIKSLHDEIAEVKSEMARWKKRYGIDKPDIGFNPN